MHGPDDDGTIDRRQLPDRRLSNLAPNVPSVVGSSRLPAGWRIMVVIAILLASVSLLLSVVLFGRVKDQSRDSAQGGRKVASLICGQQNTTRAALVDILTATEPRLQQYFREGTLTAKQLAGALADNAKAKGKLGPLDCQEFAAQIPVK